MRRTIAGLLGLALLGPLALAAARVELGRFSAQDLAGWTSKRFLGETRYTPRDGALCADSVAAASGLFREQRVDLAQTPVLHWSWKLERALTPPPGDERTKPGDDYAARIYVVFSGGALFWRTRGINYVWSSAQAAGSDWPNAFSANVRMIALRDGAAPAGEWLGESRDVRADYRRLFGEDVAFADAVAIMTDTDNAGGSAAACYGDIWFAALAP